MWLDINLTTNRMHIKYPNIINPQMYINVLNEMQRFTTTLNYRMSNYCSVADPFHFDTDPDPFVEKRIRIKYKGLKLHKKRGKRP